MWRWCVVFGYLVESVLPMEGQRETRTSIDSLSEIDTTVQ
jgi:hypothetical protein